MKIIWKEIDDFGDKPKPTPEKPWLVIRCQRHWYWGHPIGAIYAANFKNYWYANLVSWYWHHIQGWSCNTYRTTDTVLTETKFNLQA